MIPISFQHKQTLHKKFMEGKYMRYFLAITGLLFLIGCYPGYWPRGRGWCWWGYGYPFFFGGYWGPIIMWIVFFLLLYLAYQLGKRYSGNNKSLKEIISRRFPGANEELLKEIVERLERLENKEQQNTTRGKS